MRNYCKPGAVNAPNGMADPLDPCARFARLQAALDDLLSGARFTEVRTADAAGDRLVRYAQVDVRTLQAEVSRARIECDASRGRTARALRVGPSSGGPLFGR